MSTSSARSSVLAALSHAEYTFRSFTVEDWRAMAEECRRQADQRSCIDCGEDMSVSAAFRDQVPRGSVVPAPPSIRPIQPAKEHRFKDGRWSCSGFNK